MSNSFIMTESIVRPAKMPYGRLKDNGFVGIEGEHAARALVVETKDDLSAFASINLIIDDLDCGAMTKTTSGSTATLSMTLTSSMIGRSGRKICQLIMVNSDNTVVQKSSQFEAYVGRANEIERSVDDGVTIIILSEAITEMAQQAAAAAAQDYIIDSALDPTSTHAIQNKAVASEISSIKADLGDLSDTLFYDDEPSVTAFEIVQGGLSSGGANLDGATYKASRRRSSNYVPYAIGSTISCDSTYTMAIYFYTGATVSSYDSNTGYIGNTYVVPYVANAKYVRLVMKRVDEQNFADEDIPVVTYTKLISRLDDAEGSIDSIMSNASIMRPYSSADMNDYTSNGALILGYSREFEHAPNNTHGQRLLFIYSQSGVTFQMFINKTTYEYYIRQYAGGAWSEWADMTSGISFDADSELDSESTNPIQNKAVAVEINTIKASIGSKYNESKNMDIYDTSYSQSALSSNITKDVVRVMSYNVAQYDNDGAVHIGDENKKDTLIHFKQMLMHVNADIVCTQEDAEHIDSADTLAPLPCLFSPLYPYKLGVGGPALYYRKSGTVKNYALNSVTVRRGIVEVGEKQLYVYTAHLSVSSSANRQTQINDILTNAIGVDNPTYWVLCGDFNSIEVEDRSYLVNLASTNGYTLANGGYLGWINTNKVNLPLDNMLCSPKVVIIRFEVLGNWFADLWSDHYPIYCDLALLD